MNGDHPAFFDPSMLQTDTIQRDGSYPNLEAFYEPRSSQHQADDLVFEPSLIDAVPRSNSSVSSSVHTTWPMAVGTLPEYLTQPEDYTIYSDSSYHVPMGSWVSNYTPVSERLVRQRSSPVPTYSRSSPYESYADTSPRSYPDNFPNRGRHRNVPSTTRETESERTCTICHRVLKRKADRDRHIREQHLCLDPDCQSQPFQDVDELQTHMQQCHQGRYPGFFNCGSCELRENTRNHFKRKEKFETHLGTVHEAVKPIRYGQYRCLRPGCHNDRLAEGGLFFASADDLQRHRRSTHMEMLKLEEVAIPNSSEESREQSEERTVDFSESNVSKPSGKHSLDTGSNFFAKRSKRSTEGSVRSSIQSGDFERTTTRLPCPVRNDTPNQQLTASRPNSFRSSDLQPAEWKINIPLSLLGLLALHKQYAFKCAIRDFDGKQISTKYDKLNRVILLSGSCSRADLEKGKTQLESLINGRDQPRFSQKTHSKTNLKVLHRMAEREYSSHAQESVILSVDPQDDAAAIFAWTRHIHPQLEKILEDLPIGDTWSALLVRQPNEDGIPKPVIRLCSSEGQSSTVRDKIRQRIAHISQVHKCAPVDVCFFTGSTHRLVGGRDADSASNDEVPFPHYRRYWQRLGMGVSLGMSNCECVSASTGGYILANGVLYLLSVGHFVYPEFDCMCPGGIQTRTASSPSLADIRYMRKRIDQRLKELELKIADSESPIVDLHNEGDALFQSNDMRLLELYQQWRTELDKPDEDFEVGKIAYRSRGDIVQESIIRYQQLAMPVKHRMDWSLTEVKSSREGKNVHRHPKCLEPSLIDLDTETLHPEGAGVQCHETANPSGGYAYYAGSTSGFREGQISSMPAKMKGPDGIVTTEYAMLVSGCDNNDPNLFKGDSGAWILNANDQVIGMIWGWTNGYLLFTPIRAVFEDIRSKLGCDREVELLTPDSYTDHAFTVVHRKNVPDLTLAELPFRGQLASPSFSMEPEMAISELFSPMFDAVSASPSATSNRSSSPVPSLASSRSTSPETSTPPSPRLAKANVYDPTTVADTSKVMDITYIVATDDVDVRKRRKIQTLPSTPGMNRTQVVDAC